MPTTTLPDYDSMPHTMREYWGPSLGWTQSPMPAGGPGGGITGPPTSVIGDFATWANTVGTALADTTPAQAVAKLPVFTSTTNGVVPASGGVANTFLSSNGTWITITPTVPGGSAGQVQYNASGAFGGYTNTQLTALINPFTTSSSGAVSASGGGTVNFLRADGTWAAPSVGAASLVVGSTTISGGTTTRVLYDNAGILGEYTGTQITALLDPFTTALKGATPASGGGTTNFLRADGTWAAPPGGAGVPAGVTGQFQYNNAGAFGAANTWYESANVTAQRNSTNAQSIYVYNSYTSSVIYERGAFDWSTNPNVLTIGAQAAGGGAVQRQVTFVGGGLGMYFNFGSPAKNFAIAAMDGTGAASTGPGVIYADNLGLDYSNGDVVLSRASPGVLAIGTGNGDSSRVIKAKIKAGAPVVADITAGAWALIRDTTNLTTKIYYNNAGTLQSVALDGAAGISGPGSSVVGDFVTWNNTTGTVVADTTPTQATASLNVFTTALKGLAPASGGGTTNFLRADGTWAAAGGAGGTPGGSSGQMQYNNASAFGGTNQWVVDANTIEKRNGTTAQVYRVYNTYTDASNYERGVFDWTTAANTLTIGTQAAGTGSNRSLNIVSAASISLQAAGQNIAMTWGSGSQIQFHSSSGVSIIYGDIFAPDYANGDVGVSRSAAGVIAFGNGATKGDASACILAKTKAGAPTTTDVPASSWALIRDTTNNTTKLYYNNAGTLMSVALT